MPYTICYVSRAAENLSEDEIKEIFEKTKQKNNLKAIYGILLYGMNDFFQVLEGDKDVIEDLYENIILKDTRHTNIFEVIRKETKSPVFSNYSSSFNIVKNTQELEQIKDYLKTIDPTNTTSNKLKRLIRPFMVQ